MALRDELPLVSILVPSYNHERYIKDCIQGILSQTYSNIEIIIIDDASIDDSFNIIESYKLQLELKFKNVIIKRNDINRGTASTINEMIRISNGKYIETTASDDILCSNAVEKFIEACEGNERCTLVYANAIRLDENMHYPITKQNGLTLCYDDNQPLGGQLTSQLMISNFISGATSFIPRKTIEAVGTFDEKTYCEDWDFNIRASLQGEIVYIPQALVMCHVTKNSKCRNDESQGKKKARLLYNDAVYIFSKYKAYADKDVCNKFYSNQVSLAASAEDWSLVKEICDYMKKEKYNLILPIKDKVYVSVMLSPLGRLLGKR